MYTEQVSPEKTQRATADYYEKAIEDLFEVIQEKKQLHFFWPKSQRRNVEQILLLTSFLETYERFIANSTQESWPKDLDTVFIRLVTTLSSYAHDAFFAETLIVLRGLLRKLVMDVIALSPGLLHSYYLPWSSLCERNRLYTPFVQLNILGLISRFNEKDRKTMLLHLEKLSDVNLEPAFEQVFLNKSIRIGLFEMMNALVEQAKSMDKLWASLQQEFSSNHAIANLCNLYQIYLNCIQRKVERYRMKESELGNQNPYIDQDVTLTQSCFKAIETFLKYARAH